GQGQWSLRHSGPAGQASGWWMTTARSATRVSSSTRSRSTGKPLLCGALTTRPAPRRAASRVRAAAMALPPYSRTTGGGTERVGLDRKPPKADGTRKELARSWLQRLPSTLSCHNGQHEQKTVRGDLRPDRGRSLIVVSSLAFTRTPRSDE